jgi:hypothetical protein
MDKTHISLVVVLSVATAVEQVRRVMEKRVKVPMQTAMAAATQAMAVVLVVTTLVMLVQVRVAILAQVEIQMQMVRVVVPLVDIHTLQHMAAEVEAV